jgi:hypothetical protein
MAVEEGFKPKDMSLTALIVENDFISPEFATAL